MYWLSILVALALACPVSGVILVEFCPDPYLPNDRDEYLCLEGGGSLDGIVVTDGEGGFRFPPGTALGDRTVVAMDAEAYCTSHGVYPDFEWDGNSPAVPDVIRNGRFQLSNACDQLEVYSGGICLQKVEWPGQVSPRQGQVHLLVNGRWDERVVMLGQSRFEPGTYHNASGIAFVSPDCSREVFLGAVGRAEREILVSIYEFTSPVLAGHLEDAHQRGVEVRVLVEGGPVGGIPLEEHSVISRLQQCGIPVRSMAGTEMVHTPYRFLHSKYMVIDSREVLVTSENFKENGFPERGSRGNRGWGVAITHPGLAEYFRSVYTHDAAGGWTIPAVPGEGDQEIPSAREYPAEFSPYVFTGATVIPVISPDTSSLLHPLILDAQRSVDIEMAYITNETPSTLNPFLADAVNVSRRGIPVRVILDSYYYNVEGEADNDEMAGVLNDMAASEGLPLEARCADLGPGRVEKIHNKGVIVDGEKVLISSINWNQNSPTFNREAGVILHHHGVGEYYTRAFERDWEAAGKEGPEGGPDLLKISLACAVIGALLLFCWLRRRAG
ncbi:MAG: phospholipase D-like domain-containing protein [Methanolinea sp.]|nr:phospholipase D-like domain-containing protein [Methanolinea sp.]